ncbi:diguanylate cyclase (GGDEF) domain protein [Peptoanaerobacter stomatis]|uniref:Diguanylate cyclase (GGDEF) domain protein n=1 Tax=Peptoanaerobacter stomatis TaxID=796937 RepID=J6HAY8_9FIRM|nr:diguanylate cyclase [Peptoanaerobacter stomatis]EJU20013.1 diguanylate cyclase (GGDEF) domain protein [Peptoanaerobacter stomatis]
MQGVLEFIIKIGFIVSIMLLSGSINNRIKNRTLNSIVQGIVFGIVVIVDMSVPFVVMRSESSFDVREVLINISGIFYGPLGGGITSLVAFVFRAYRHTNGTIPALVDIVLTYIFTVIAYKKIEGKKISPRDIFILSFLTNFVSIIAILINSHNRNVDSIPLYIAIMIIYPIATVISAELIKTINLKNQLMKELIDSEEKLQSQNKQLQGTVLEIRNKEYLLKKSEEMFKNIFLNSSDASFVLDKAVIIQANRESLYLLNYDNKKELIGKSVLDFFYDNQKEEFLQILEEVLNEKDIKKCELLMKDKNNIDIDVEVTISKVNFSNKDFAYMSFRDIRLRKSKEEELVKKSQVDILTGVYNRVYLNEYVINLKPEQYPIGIIVADLNGLKLINDFFGHSRGDTALADTASVLAKMTPENGFVVRMGGDEFTVIFNNTSKEEIKSFVENTLNEFKNKKVFYGELSVSMGAAISYNENEYIVKTMNLADKEMYEIKILESQKFKERFLEIIYNISLDNNRFKKTYKNCIEECCRKLAYAIDLDETTMENLMLLTKYYDVGDIYLESKSFEVSAFENTYNLTKQISKTMDISLAILYFMENWNGSGKYRIKGEDIPLISRILRIVNDYYYELDIAHNDNRILSDTDENDVAVEKLQRKKAEFYDPYLLDIFMNLEKDSE